MTTHYPEGGAPPTTPPVVEDAGATGPHSSPDRRPPLDLITAARHLGDLKTAYWDAIRAFNTDEGPASAVYAASDALGNACEDFRRRFYPRAREVFAVCDHTIGQPLSVYRRTPSGRAVTVYDEAEVERS